MKKLLMISALAGLAGCANMDLFGPRTLPPATPVFFQPMSVKLDQPALNTIQTVAQAAAAKPQAGVIVTGAADNVGTAADNQQLSEARAQVVAQQLEADGVAASRITVRGEGVAPNNAPSGAGAQVARRALIQLTD